MAAVEAALAVSQRVSRSLQLSKIGVGTDMDPADQLQIIIQNLIKIPAFLTGLCKDHRQMQAYNADIKTAYKYGRILLICRIHTASLIPG